MARRAPIFTPIPSTASSRSCATPPATAPTALHAVDLDVPSELRSAGGRLVRRWTICELGLWAGPASLYNLLNHRAPLKRLGHCPNFAPTPPAQMRPELLRQRVADQVRAWERRAWLRQARLGQAS